MKVVGTNGDDDLVGTTFSDIMEGRDGDDVIDGGAGRDVMRGGRGDDRFTVSKQSDLVRGEIFNGGSGEDTLTIDFADFGDAVDLSRYRLTSIERILRPSGAGLTLSSSQISNLTYYDGGTLTLADSGPAILHGIFKPIYYNLAAAGSDFDISRARYDTITIYGAGGSDRVRVSSQGSFGTTVYGYDGDDWLSGRGTFHAGAGNDTIEGSDLADLLDGDDGDDILIGGGGADTIYAGAGLGSVDGGDGDDDIYLDHSFIRDGGGLSAGSGDDTVHLIDDDLTGADLSTVENLRIAGLVHMSAAQVASFVTVSGGGSIALTTGGKIDFGDTVVENVVVKLADIRSTIDFSQMHDVRSYVIGGSKTDVITGGTDSNILQGEGGDDRLIAGAGYDVLTGGAGGDAFTFQTLNAGERADFTDQIADFSHSAGDTIDLSRMDANPDKVGDQSFRWIGQATFSGSAGELRGGGVDFGYERLEGDLDGDKVADFTILVQHVDNLTIVRSDLIL